MKNIYKWMHHSITVSLWVSSTFWKLPMSRQRIFPIIDKHCYFVLNLWLLLADSASACSQFYTTTAKFFHDVFFFYLQESRWNFLFSFLALPALLQLCVLPCLPESPRYLLIERRDEAGAERGRVQHTTGVNSQHIITVT